MFRLQASIKLKQQGYNEPFCGVALSWLRALPAKIVTVSVRWKMTRVLKHREKETSNFKTRNRDKETQEGPYLIQYRCRILLELVERYGV